jgi:hypothetical protein
MSVFPLIVLLFAVLVLGQNDSGVLNSLVAANDRFLKEFRGQISRYNNDREVNFMSLLVYTLQLRNSPYWERLEVAGLPNNLPESIKTIATSNFCLKSFIYNRFLFAFKNSYFSAPMTDQRIGSSNGTKPRTGAEWSVDASEDGGSLYLKNVYLGQYLYATEDRIGLSSAYLKMAFGQKENSDRFKWVFIPDDDTGSRIAVQNVKQKKLIELSCGHSDSLIYTVCSSTGTSDWQKWEFERC